MRTGRFKDSDWALPRSDSGHIDSWQLAQIAVLMDIRDELKQLNRVFACANFQNIPHVLGRISANTAKPKRKKATK